MTKSMDRLDGWKAIAAYLGRDRSTVIRWHHQRGLPVRAIPGGKSKTVYAFKSDLDDWTVASSQTAEPLSPSGEEQSKPKEPDSVAPTSSAPPEAAPFPERTSSTYHGLLGALVLTALLCASIVLFAITFNKAASSEAAEPSLPKNHQIANLYVQATDDLGRRETESIALAGSEFRSVIEAEPDFAPAYAGLAETYLLQREFGSLNDDAAFPKAKLLARRAEELAPSLASAHRVSGFISYWWDHDRTAAAKSFHLAIAADSRDPQTHLWYANVLADNGEFAASEREFRAAKFGRPGSLPIGIDEAWMIWSAGQDSIAKSRLADIVDQDANIASAHDCLSLIRLGDGDLEGYARELALRASLRDEAQLSSYSDEITTAVKQGDEAAVSKAMLTRATSLQADAPRADHALAAFFASMLGQRDKLVRILTSAARAHAVWGAAGFRSHILRRWPGDAQIASLVARLAPPPMETPLNS